MDHRVIITAVDSIAEARGELHLYSAAFASDDLNEQARLGVRSLMEKTDKQLGQVQQQLCGMLT